MKRWIPYLIIIGVIVVFFFQIFLYGKVPFPGDLLLSEYTPWRNTAYSGYGAGGVPNKGQYFDVIRELYPWKTLVIDEIKKGNIPLWNPYNFSGNPLLANFQSQALYPLTIIYYVFSQPIAWTIFLLIQPLLSSIFMYLYCQKLGLSKKGSLFGSLVFSFSSFMSVWFEFSTVGHTVLWLPLLLYLIETIIASKKILSKYLLFLIFTVYCVLTAGHPQDAMYVLIFFFLYLLTRIIKESLPLKQKISKLFPFIIASCTAFLLACPQLLPTIELFTKSARVGHNPSEIFSFMLLKIWQLPMVLYQDVFGNPATRTYFLNDTYVTKVCSIGCVGFILSFLSLFRFKKDWYIRFFAISAFLILILSIRSPLTEFIYQFPIPILSTGTPTRILFLFLFSLSILSAFGWDNIKNVSKKQLIIIILPLTILLIFIWSFAFFQFPFTGFIKTSLSGQIMKKSAIIASLLTGMAFFLIYFSQKRKVFLFCIYALAFFELMYGFIKFNPFVPISFVFPNNQVIEYLQQNAGINRFWGYGTGRIEANFATQYKVFSPDGTDPLNLSWYNQLLQSGKDGYLARTFSAKTRADVVLAPGYGSDDLPNNTNRLRLMDVLGVRYILNRDENPTGMETFPNERYRPLPRLPDGWQLFENTLAAPRYFLSSDILYYSSPDEFESKFFDPSFIPQKQVLQEEKDASSLSSISKGEGRVNLERYSPNKIVFTVSTDSPQILFLSDTFDQGWKATIDSVETKIYKADYAFRSVLVPKGDHRIVFSYFPKSFQYGIYCSLIGLCGTIIILAMYLWKRKKQ